MGNTEKLMNQIMELKFTSKSLHRQARKCEKEEKSEKLKIEKGNTDGARIYAENAIRKRNEQMSALRLHGCHQGLRRPYCLRWSVASPTGKPRECAWKKLYIQRDQDDMVEFVRNTPPEFKEYYIKLQVAKRSQAPLPSQVSDDRIILDKIVGDQVSIWKRTRGFTNEAVTGHVCSGHICSYTQIGDVFLCEEDRSCTCVSLCAGNSLLRAIFRLSAGCY